MFETIKYHLQLRKYENELSRIEKNYAKHKKELSGDKLQRVRDDASGEALTVLELIDILKTMRFRHIANRLMVPLPDMKDEKLWEDHMGTQILSSKGIWELKKLIREEKRERRQWIALVTALITAIAGAIGATAGLVAILGQTK